MFSYDHGTGVMYTCDAFGLHYCTADPYDSELEPLAPHYAFYYDCLMRPNAKYGGSIKGPGSCVLRWKCSFFSDHRTA